MNCHTNCIRFYVKRELWKNYGIMLIILWFSFTSGFLSRNPLRNIIVSKAVTSSIIENLSSELFDNAMIINQICCFNCNHNYFAFYLAGFLWYKFYGGEQFSNGDNKKLVVFDSYMTSRRITRQILFVLLFLLTKNVENVY